ncbi:MAG: AbrB/MazE/SpoVT family DNA-binding domain-containing protein [bacterium]|nr:AbrB/MazE/SpoVT family DNA-binding domain-containing protein [bacterium]
MITRKGQVTIPKAIRDFVDWREGERVSFLVRGPEIVMKRQRGTILDLKGSVKPSRHPEDFDDIRRQVERQRGARSAK